MITYDDAGHLLGLAAARDQRTVGKADVLAWHADLTTAGVTRADAEIALARFYVEQARLEPRDRFRVTTVDVIAIAKQIREQRLENFRYEPPPGDTDPDYLLRLRGQIAITAAGVTATPDALPALEGGPHPDVAAQLEHVGRTVPDRDDPETPPIKRPGPLGITCPKCTAPTGRPCRLPSGAERRPHPARVRVARGEPAALEDPNEIARRRAVSERRAALEGADQ